MKYYLLAFIILLSYCPIVSAEDLEVVKVNPLSSVGVVKVQASGKNELIVEHNVTNETIFIECFINGFTFSKENEGSLPQEGEGHIRLYVEDNHVATLFQPAFYIENLQSGTHEIKIMVVNNDRSPYEDLEETLVITIP